MNQIVVRRKRDEAVRRKSRNLAKLGPADPRYAPARLVASRLIITTDRVYESLRTRELINADGSVIPAVESFRRLCDSTTGILKALGLMPTSVLPDARAASLDAVFERIERTKKARDKDADEPAASAE